MQDEDQGQGKKTTFNKHQPYITVSQPRADQIIYMWTEKQPYTLNECMNSKQT